MPGDVGLDADAVVGADEDDKGRGDQAADRAPRCLHRLNSFQ